MPVPGPRGEGASSKESNIRTRWTTAPPKVWERKIGPAFSGFAIVGDRLYTCGTDQDQQALYCLHTKSGALLWKHPIEKMVVGTDPALSGARATPVVRDGRVFVMGAAEFLVCCDAISGKPSWKASLANRPAQGHTASVLVVGSLAIVPGGEKTVGLTAFDAATGEVAWKTGKGRPGNATPALISIDGTDCVCSAVADKLLFVTPGSGKVVGEIELGATSEPSLGPPIWRRGRLFVPLGRGRGGAVYRVRRTGGKVVAKEQWRNLSLENKYAAPLLYEGKLYGCDEAGLKCVDFLTGRTYWRSGDVVSNEYANGALALAAGRLFVLTTHGELQVSRASPSGFRPETSVNLLEGPCWTSPVVLDGRLYARDRERVACFDVRDRRRAPRAGATAR